MFKHFISWLIGQPLQVVLDSIEQFRTEVYTKMSEVTDQVAALSGKLDKIDAVTTDTGARVKTAVDDLKTIVANLESQGGQADAEDIAALKELGTRLDGEATAIANIYSGDTGAVAGDTGTPDANPTPDQPSSGDVSDSGASTGDQTSATTATLELPSSDTENQ